MYYKLAYRNESTEWEWYEISHHETAQSAIECANDHAKTDLQHSEMGIFGMPEGARYWKDRRPRRVINYQRKPGDDLLPSALGGLINLVNSDFTINKDV